MRFLRDPQVVLTALCGIALVVSFFGLHPAVPYAAVLFGSYFALTSAWESLRERRIDVNMLMVLAAIGAIVVPLIPEAHHGSHALTPEHGAMDAAALLFLFSLSSTLESLAMSRTRSAIEGLVRLRPDQAIRLSPEGEETVPVEALKIGDEVRVPPFEAVPVDGVVRTGAPSIDQSAMTGESVPVALQPGDRVLAGTRNVESAFTLEVASTVGDSTLDKIVALVEDAQENKASGERISSWFGQRYTLFVLAAFVVSFVARSAFGATIDMALYASLTLLVALSPCALVISTPASTLSALALAARKGILVRGGEFIEKAGKVDTLALDKTGTLTVGQPRLVEICVCAPSPVGVGGGVSCTDDGACWRAGDGPMSTDSATFLRMAAAAEQDSRHPVAVAIRRAASEAGVTIPTVSRQASHPGLGIDATVEGRRVCIGQPRLFRELGIALPKEFEDHARHLEEEGMTLALIAVDDRLAALGFMDQPRPEVGAFLAKAREAGVEEIVMITGDTPVTAASVARQVGISDVRAGLMPTEKTEAVQGLVAQGRTVMMVGDGVNDAPALACANVGVAMGGLGSDIALNAADVVLMHDRLDRIPFLMRLGQMTNRVIRANLIFASAVIVTLTAFSLFGKLPLPIAVIGHEGSTVLVILNGLRLLKGPREA